jgi:two-component system alkaline phosphatase synthesis response regulator PhoP
VPKKVLIGDDEPYILEGVSLIVEKEHFTALTARDGVQVVKVARAEMPDLLLLDIMMPEKDGYEVCKELKSDPATRGIYIIVLTAKGQERDEELAYKCGADDVMKKPFDTKELREKLHRLLD